MTPGHTNNLVIYADGKEIYNRKKGDARLHKDTAVQFLEKVSNLIGSQWFIRKISQQNKIWIKWRLRGKTECPCKFDKMIFIIVYLLNLSIILVWYSFK